MLQVPPGIRERHVLCVQIGVQRLGCIRHPVFFVAVIAAKVHTCVFCLFDCMRPLAWVGQNHLAQFVKLGRLLHKEAQTHGVAYRRKLEPKKRRAGVLLLVSPQHQPQVLPIHHLAFGSTGVSTNARNSVHRIRVHFIVQPRHHLRQIQHNLPHGDRGQLF